MNTAKAIGEVAGKSITRALAHSTKVVPLNMPEWERWFNFKTFNDPQLMRMLEAAARFILDVRAGNRCPWQVLVGSTNAGKTHLARRCWQWWDRAGKWKKILGKFGEANVVRSGQFVRWVDFIRECYNKDSSRADDLIDDEFVVIDDIGAGTDTRKWMADKLYAIVEHRCDAPNKSTLITANLSLEQIAAEFDPRIAGRLIRNGSDKVVNVKVPDFCLRK